MAVNTYGFKTPHKRRLAKMYLHRNNPEKSKIHQEIGRISEAHYNQRR